MNYSFASHVLKLEILLAQVCGLLIYCNPHWWVGRLDWLIWALWPLQWVSITTWGCLGAEKSLHSYVHWTSHILYSKYKPADGQMREHWKCSGLVSTFLRYAWWCICCFLCMIEILCTACWMYHAWKSLGRIKH